MLADNTEQSSILAKESIPLQTKTEPVKIKERKERPRSPRRTDAREEQINQAEKTESEFSMTVFNVTVHLYMNKYT